MKAVIILDGNRVYQGIGYEVVGGHVGGEMTIGVIDVLGRRHSYVIFEEDLEEFELRFQNTLYHQAQFDMSGLIIREF